MEEEVIIENVEDVENVENVEGNVETFETFEMIETDVPPETAEYILTTEETLSNGLTYSENVVQISDASRGIFVFVFVFFVILVCRLFFKFFSWFF